MQLAAAAAMAAGLAVVLHLPLPGPWRLAAAVAWLSSQLAGLAAWSRAAAGWRRLSIRPQGVQGLFEDGIWRDLVLRPGSLVTRRWAWLRFADGEGRSTCAVLRASTVPAPSWRRLVAWYRAGR